MRRRRSWSVASMRRPDALSRTASLASTSAGTLPDSPRVSIDRPAWWERASTRGWRDHLDTRARGGRAGGLGERLVRRSGRRWRHLSRGAPGAGHHRHPRRPRVQPHRGRRRSDWQRGRHRDQQRVLVAELPARVDRLPRPGRPPPPRRDPGRLRVRRRPGGRSRPRLRGRRSATRLGSASRLLRLLRDTSTRPWPSPRGIRATASARRNIAADAGGDRRVACTRAGTLPRHIVQLLPAVGC